MSDNTNAKTSTTSPHYPRLEALLAEKGRDIFAYKWLQGHPTDYLIFKAPVAQGPQNNSSLLQFQFRHFACDVSCQVEAWLDDVKPLPTTASKRRHIYEHNSPGRSQSIS